MHIFQPKPISAPHPPRFPVDSTAIGRTDIPTLLREIPSINGFISLRSNAEAARPLEMHLRRSAIGHAGDMLSLEAVSTLVDAASGAISRWRWGKHGIRASGRSLIMQLPEEAWFERRGVLMTALRFKGVTDHGRPPSTRPYKPSGDSQFLPSTRKIAVVEGKVFIRKAPLQPTGHLVEQDSKTEFMICCHAFQLGLPVQYPIGIGQFTTRRFLGQRLGVVAYAIPEADNLRLIDVRNYSAAQGLVREACSILRDFHRQGICHWNPHHGNFFLGHNYQVGMCDFEDSKATSLHNLGEDEFALYRCRDILSILRNLRVHHQERFALQEPTFQGFLRKTLLDGYFASASPCHLRRIDEAISEAAEYPETLDFAIDERNGLPMLRFLNQIYNRSRLFAAIIDAL